MFQSKKRSHDPKKKQCGHFELEEWIEFSNLAEFLVLCDLPDFLSVYCLFSKIHCTNPNTFLTKCVNIITAALFFCILMYLWMHKITYYQHENIFAALCTTYWRLDNWADLSFISLHWDWTQPYWLWAMLTLCRRLCNVCIWSINMERKDVGI